MVAYDVATLPWSKDGFRYVLIMVDLFSKYVEAMPMKDQTAQSITEALDSGWFLRHGYPLALLSDQGQNVDGCLVRQLCRRLGIEKLHSTPYHPQGDGEAERSIQSFKQAMRCLLAEKDVGRTEWPKLLREVCFLHNAQSNASSVLAPNEVMFGTQLRTRVDAALRLGGMETKKERNKELYEEVASNLETAREKMSRYYDRGTRRTDVEEGDWVLLKDEARSDSLAPLYRGPWHVAEKRGVNVHLSVPGVSSRRVVHLNRCKRAPAPVTEVPNSSTRQDPCGSSPTATAATPPEQIPDDIQSPTIEAEDSEAMGENEGRVTVEQQPRRSVRQRKVPDRYGERVMYVLPHGPD